MVDSDTNKEKWFLSGETNLLGCNATKQEQMCQLEGYGLTGKRPFATQGFSTH